MVARRRNRAEVPGSIPGNDTMKNENTVKSLMEFVEKKIADNKADLVKYKGMDQMAFIYDNVGDKIGKLEGENIAYEEVLKKIILIW